MVGAGISGLAAGYHLQASCLGQSFAILEARDALGGTWDLFRYPGIRSDSDIFTLGFSFKPWRGRESIAGAPAILGYLREAASEQGLDQHIRYGHRLCQASWDSATARWSVEVERSDGSPPVIIQCRFLFMCSGYYAYSRAHRPDFAGEHDFRGPIVHPQFWPEDLDHRGKRVLVIGSGATAITLVPALARHAAHVTMVQRSPTYLVARPSTDRLANALRAVLPAKLAYRLVRWKFIARDLLFYKFAIALPAATRALLLGLLRWKLGPGHDIARDFTPRYLPWRQRLCLVPDGDFFDSINAGKAAIETGEIDRFTATGIRLRSGKELPADIIVTATGLEMELMSGVQLLVDGVPVSPAQTIGYKGCMYSGIPNLASSFGYENASWTLKAELTCRYVCRLLQHMEAEGKDFCIARATGVEPGEDRLLNLDAGYVTRALGRLPRQGRRAPWKALHNYFADSLLLGRGRLDDGALEFLNASARAP